MMIKKKKKAKRKGKPVEVINTYLALQAVGVRFLVPPLAPFGR